MARCVGITPAAPSCTNWAILVQNSRTAPVGRPSDGRVLYFWSWLIDWKYARKMNDDPSTRMI
jgi:hypothetical protein